MSHPPPPPFGAQLRPARRPCTPIQHGINRLPTELLSDIFLRFCPDGFRTVVCQICGSSEAKEWWFIPWVCQRWREIALGTPRYWAVPLFSSHDLLDVMLQRARHASLTIHLHEAALKPALDSTRIFATVLAHLEHTENLVLHCTWATLERAIAPGGALAQRAPILRTCSITCTDGRVAEVPFIPLDFLAGHAPKLEALHLAGCWTKWASPLLQSTIRVLVFTSTYIPLADQPGAVLAALERMPQLKHLILYRKGQISTNGDVSPSLPSLGITRSVVLPHLRQCVMMTTLADTCALMDALLVPSTASVTATLDIPDDPPFTRSIDALAHSLGQRFVSPVSASITPLRSMRVLASVYDDTDTFRLSAATQCQPDVFTGAVPPSRVEPSALTDSSLDVAVSGSLRRGGSVPAAIGTLLGTLPLRAVSELVVDFGIYTLMPAWWHAAAACMPALDTVVAYGHNAADTLFAFLDAAPVPDGAFPESPMPALRSLALVGLDLLFPSRCTALLRALRRRGRIGVGMHRLSLRGCALPLKRVLELQANVRDIIVIVDEKAKVAPESPSTQNRAHGSSLSRFELSQL
ncbi:hypothetical protein K488DRAFT_89064 [Vararia minispora EC-137]|uniref:Uncharacterized protein n=1 Tax=Vararia minispora EC-137 TaxID=1314806 RepID=A0ACB8QCV0_9AGAM|nr:hypothetical protein K488DRAFT_89064 [Vararia minispora EC-137]